MATFNGNVLSNDTFTHLEVEADRASVAAFVQQLQQELQNNDPVYRLQIQRSGVNPQVGGGTPITAGNTVAVTLHRHP